MPGLLIGDAPVSTDEHVARSTVYGAIERNALATQATASNGGSLR